MGSVVIGTIIDEARAQLLETIGDMAPNTDNARWYRSGDLLAHGNAAIREIVGAKGDTLVSSVPFELADGALQGLPSDGLRFSSVSHNLGADGATPGRRIGMMSRDALSRWDPTWMTKVGSEVQCYVFDQDIRDQWFCYPRPSGTWHVQLNYFGDPAPISAADIDDATNGVIPIDNVWAPQIRKYIVGTALMKNGSAFDVQKASVLLRDFASSIGVRFKSERTFEPKEPVVARNSPDVLGTP